MHRIAVSSRLIAEIAYDPDLQNLDVTFHDGFVRQLEKVPTQAISGLLTSTSPGHFYMNHIRKIYPRRGNVSAARDIRTA